MKHLIIVGNGFDLSLGLKTSYSDFLTDLVRQDIDDYGSLNVQQMASSPWMNHFQFGNADRKNAREFIQGKLSLMEFILGEQARIKNGNDLEDFLVNGIVNKSKSVSNFIWDLIYFHEPLDWVKIEEKFFEYLYDFSTECDESNVLLPKSERTTKVQSLNDELKILTKALGNYLSDIQIEHGNSIFTQKHRNWMFEVLKGANLFSKDLNGHCIEGQMRGFASSLLINFNYTNFANQLFNVELKNGEILQIHGNVENFPNDLIFGYGHRNEESRYQELLDLDIDGSLDFLKMFKYVKNKSKPGLDISILDNFLQGQHDIMVTIIGHSCGVSDANLLESIFQNKNCKHINICYKDENSWERTAAQILKRIGNDEDFREKMMPINPNLKMPQT